MNMPHRLLLERGDGFQLDRNLLEQQQNLNDLARDDPWSRLQYLLRQLQQGRFGELALLSEMMARHRSGAFWHAGATLLGFAGPPNIITRVIDGLMTSSIPPGPTERVYFCAAFAASCGLWAIPRILEIYSTLSDLQLRSEVEVYLSNLLEEEPGPIWHGPVSRVEYDEAPLPFRGERTSIDFDSYAALVAKQRSDLLKSSDTVALGRPLSLAWVAKCLLEDVRRAQDSGRVEWGRMLFEAMTGIDCRSFYGKDGSLQSLAAAAVLEAFLDSGEIYNFTPGARYFFGHMIPD